MRRLTYFFFLLLVASAQNRQKSNQNLQKEGCKIKGEGCNAAAFSLPLCVIRFTFDNLALTYNKFMQLVTPSVVAIAVKIDGCERLDDEFPSFLFHNFDSKL